MDQRMTLRVISLLVIQLISAISSTEVNFVTDKMYDSMVLNCTGNSVKGVTPKTSRLCAYRCMMSTSCVSFAVNTSPEVNDCILYETNLCDISRNVELTNKDGYRIYDKVVSATKRSCAARQQNLRKCLKNVPRFNISDKGCPTGFTWRDIVCYQVINNPVNYSNAQNAAHQLLGSKLAKLRDSGVQDLLVFLLKAAGVIQTKREGIWLGARDYGNGSNTTAIWRWEDGSTFNPWDTQGFIQWDIRQPEYHQEENIMMGPPEFCWSDEPFNVVVKVLCQAKNLITCQAGFSLNTENNICYGIFNISTILYEAAEKCRPMPAAAGVPTTKEEWQFVINLIKQSDLANYPFSAGFSLVADNSHFASTEDVRRNMTQFGQWCPGQPDYVIQACLKLAFDSATSTTLLDDHFCKMKFAFAVEWIASSCNEWYQLSNRSNGLFRVLPRGALMDIQVYCDMTTDGGGWTVIQARPGKSSTTFLRDITEYINGFGDVATDFWLGLDQIVLLTSQEMVNLLLTFEDASGRSYVIKYINFQLSNNSDSPYTFTVGNFETASELPDEFGKQQNVPFSVDTKKGGWWFASGSTVNLNGVNFTESDDDSASFMQWSPDLLITNTKMKIRPSTYSECVQYA